MVNIFRNASWRKGICPWLLWLDSNRSWKGLELQQAEWLTGSPTVHEESSLRMRPPLSPRCHAALVLDCIALVQRENREGGLAFRKQSPVPNWNEDATCQAHMLFESFLGNTLVEMGEWGARVVGHSVCHKPSFTWVSWAESVTWQGSCVLPHPRPPLPRAGVVSESQGTSFLYSSFCWREVDQEGYKNSERFRYQWQRAKFKELCLLGTSAPGIWTPVCWHSNTHLLCHLSHVCRMSYYVFG